jgi:hypothetical protein
MSKTSTAARRNVSAMVGGEQTVSLRFKAKKSLGEFAALLRDHQVPYELAGFQTIVVPLARLNSMPQHLAGLLNQAAAQKTVSVASAPSRGKRAPLITPAKAKELLRRFSREL